MLIASACFLNVHKNNRDVSTVRSSLKLIFTTSTELLYCYFDGLGKIFGCRNDIKSSRFRHLINVVKRITQVLSPEFKRCIVCMYKTQKSCSFFGVLNHYGTVSFRGIMRQSKKNCFGVTV